MISTLLGLSLATSQQKHLNLARSLSSGYSLGLIAAGRTEI
nr:MAG TPA: hypothetical protein [Caudoviricetes sp.]